MNNPQMQKTAEQIRRQYLSPEEDQVRRLRRLDSRVKTPGRILSYVMGTVGALTMGAGMSLVMVWHNMAMGLALGIPGMVVALLAYPAYNLVTRGRKKKFAPEILRLSAELMGQ